jgi:LL-diaminopimelate aminotransferase
MGLNVKPPQAGLYIWARVPEGFTSSEFTAALLDKAGVAVTPGTGYGKYGEGYIRVSLTIPDDQLKEGIRRLNTWHIA